jgi:copper(I)-binding protein
VTVNRPTQRIAGPVILAAAGLLALAGCGSGLEAQTYESRAAYGSTNADAGPLSVRHVSVPAPDAEGYAKGANADVVLSLATRADGEDRLVSATSPDATSVEVPEGLTVKPGQLALDKRITLLGLKRVLRGSDYVVVDLTFASGGSVSVNVPVAVGTDPPEENPDFTIPETDSVGDPLVEKTQGGH